MVATSVGITARVLSGMGLLDAPTTRIILGATGFCFTKTEGDVWPI